MKTWLKELGCVALIAAVSAVVIPRVMLPPLAAARQVRGPRALSEAPTPTTITLAMTPSSPTEPPLPPDAPDGPPVPPAHATPPRGAHRSGANPRGISYVNRHWVADLGQLPPVRTALAGTTLAPPNEGPHREGYRVVSTDRMGLLRTAGIRPGDVLIGVNGMPLRNPDDTLDALSRLRNTSRATFEFQRGASRYQVPVELIGRAPGRTLVL